MGIYGKIFPFSTIASPVFKRYPLNMKQRKLLLFLILHINLIAGIPVHAIEDKGIRGFACPVHIDIIEKEFNSVIRDLSSKIKSMPPIDTGIENKSFQTDIPLYTKPPRKRSEKLR